MVPLCMAMTPSLTRTGGGENMRYVMKCRNRKCTTEIISNDADRCPACGTTDIETESIEHLDTMGISETRIFHRVGVGTKHACAFVEMKNDRRITANDLVLSAEMASNARYIRVTVDIVE